MSDGFYGFQVLGNIKITKCEDARPEWLGDMVLNYTRSIAYEGQWYLLSKRVLKLELKEGNIDLINASQVLLEIERGLRTSIPSALLIAQDSSECDYGYIINIDTKKLDLYFGYQKQPQDGNPFGTTSTSHGYYPCKYVGSVDPFTATLEDIIDIFEKEMKIIENSYLFLN